MPVEESQLLHLHSPVACETGIVDDINFIIRGVSLITGDCIAEGHDLLVDSTTVSQLHALAKDRGKVPVNLDHGSGIKDMNGYIDNFRMDGAKMRGDWHLLKSHAESMLMLERAQEMPECFGLSVAFKGKGVKVKGGKKAARAEKLLSIDCVTRPAANEGLFAAKDPRTVDIHKKSMAGENQNQGNPATLEDVMQALGTLSTKMDTMEQNHQAISSRLDTVEAGGQAAPNLQEAEETLRALHGATDAELAELGLTRAEVNQAVDDYNAAVAADDANGEAAGEEDAAAAAAAGAGGEGATAGAMAGVGGSGGGGEAAATFGVKALAREVFMLKAEIQKEKARKQNEAEEVEFAASAQKIILIGRQRDEAIELCQTLMAKVEAQDIALRTGTRPVKPGVNDGERLFAADDNGELHQFQQLIVAKRKADPKLSEGAAIQLASRERPDLHKDFIETGAARRNQTLHS